MSANVNFYVAPMVINQVRHRKFVFVVFSEEPYISHHLNVSYIYTVFTNFFNFLLHFSAISIDTIIYETNPCFKNLEIIGKYDKD